jgi:hypothetical protein
MSAVASVALSLICLLNVIATIWLVRSTIATVVQKSWQVVIIWLVPVIGAITVIAVLLETRYTLKPRLNTGDGGEIWPPGIGPGYGSHHGGGGGDLSHGDP